MRDRGRNKSPLRFSLVFACHSPRSFCCGYLHLFDCLIYSKRAFTLPMTFLPPFFSQMNIHVSRAVKMLREFNGYTKFWQLKCTGCKCWRHVLRIYKEFIKFNIAGFSMKTPFMLLYVQTKILLSF